MDKRLINIDELAEYLSVKTATIYGWVHEKKVPYKKLGRLVRFDFAEIEQWLKSVSVGNICK